MFKLRVCVEWGKWTIMTCLKSTESTQEMRFSEFCFHGEDITSFSCNCELVFTASMVKILRHGIMGAWEQVVVAFFFSDWVELKKWGMCSTF